jgi:hypothetical protein
MQSGIIWQNLEDLEVIKSIEDGIPSLRNTLLKYYFIKKAI